MVWHWCLIDESVCQSVNPTFEQTFAHPEWTSHIQDWQVTQL